MTTRDINGNGQRGRFWEQLLGGLSRYDLLLAAMPLVFAVGLVVYAVAPVPMHVAVGGGAALSGLLLIDAFYLNPPTADRTSQPAEAPTSAPTTDSSGASPVSASGD